MAVKSFRDLVVWQESHKLARDVYESFRGCKDWGFKDQIQRASVSVMSNIAEGYGRKSDKTLNQYLLISRGSLAEVESLLVIALDLGYANKTSQENLLAQTETVTKLINGFVRKLAANGQ